MPTVMKFILPEPTCYNHGGRKSSIYYNQVFISGPVMKRAIYICHEHVNTIVPFVHHISNCLCFFVQLADCRGRDRACTLLKYVVQQIQKNCPELLEFIDELMPITLLADGKFLFYNWECNGRRWYGKIFKLTCTVFFFRHSICRAIWEVNLVIFTKIELFIWIFTTFVNNCGKTQTNSFFILSTLTDQCVDFVSATTGH